MHYKKNQNNTIEFPRNLNHISIGYVNEKLREIVTGLAKYERIIFLDAKRLKFIDAIALTVLYNQVSFLKSIGWKPYISNFKNDIGELSKAIKFMDDSEFFLRVSDRRLSDSSTCRDTTFPLKVLKHSETVMWLENESMVWLARKLNTDKSALTEIKICLDELFNNTKDHSGEESSCAFIQHYPKLKKICICIADGGIGIIQKIQKAHPKFTDEECIQHAIQEGFTTKSTHRNAGMGLFTLTRTVCNNGGSLAIRSGKLHALITPGDNQEPRIQYLTDCPWLDGTAYEIVLYENKLDILQPVLEDFEWD